MCLLTYFDYGVQPDCEALLNGATYNDDGHGFAIVDLHNWRIIVEKGMRGEVMIDRFAKLRAQYPDGPAIFHSRINTDGIGGKYNIHPFEVSGYATTWLAHNGMFPNEARPKLNDIRSDTRIVAEHVSGKYGFNLTTGKGRRKFGKWMGNGNKVVILTLDPQFNDYAYIINEHLGAWVGDTWYSNDSYLPRFRYQSKKWWEQDDWEEYKVGNTIAYRRTADGTLTPTSITSGAATLGPKEWAECEICMMPDAVQPSSQKCRHCKSCADCTMNEEGCQCWAAGDEHSLSGKMCFECGEDLAHCACDETEDRLQAVLDSLPSVREASMAVVAETLSELGWPSTAVKVD